MGDSPPDELMPSPRLELDMVMVVSLMIWLFTTLEETALLVPDVLETGAVSVVDCARISVLNNDKNIMGTTICKHLKKLSNMFYSFLYIEERILYWGETERSIG